MNINFTALSILFGFALVAGALYISEGGSMMQSGGGSNATSVVRVTDRHIYGNKNAPIVIVEYSDFECPFCAKHHPTLQKIADESNGQIAWEYRHFPLPSHPLADDAAILSECVAKHAGEEAFWRYTSALFAGSITESFIESEALEYGLTTEEIEVCKTDPELQAIVDADMAAVKALGLNSTPSNVVVFEDGSVKTIAGALPYDQFMAELNK